MQLYLHEVKYVKTFLFQFLKFNVFSKIFIPINIFHSKIKRIKSLKKKKSISYQQLYTTLNSKLID